MRNKMTEHREGRKNAAGSSHKGYGTGNKGQSLIELLVAFAVSAVILAGLSYLLFTGLRLYDRNDVNTRIQNEAQNALNLLTDHIMEAKGVCMEAAAADADLQCILIDELEVAASAAGGYDAWFAGEAVIVRILDDAGGYVGKMYLLSFPMVGGDAWETDLRADGINRNKLVSGAATQAEAAGRARENIQDYFLHLPADKKTAWLMAEHITACEIVPADGVTLERYDTHYEDGSTQSEYYVTEPFGLKVSITFELESQTGITNRTVKDTIYVRNKLPGIYADKDGSMKEYLCR